MRGQSKKQMSLEESCRAGACPRRLILVCAGNFAACGRRGTFPAMGKHPKDRRGTPQRRTSFANDGLPPVPHYGGRVPESRQKISGAQNLSDFPRFLPGHWALSVPKLRLMQFPFRAWVCRANAPGAYLGGSPKGFPYPVPEDFLETRRGGTEGKSAEGREKPLWGVPLPRAGPRTARKDLYLERWLVNVRRRS